MADPRHPSSVASQIHSNGDYPDSLTLREPPDPAAPWLRELSESIGRFLDGIAPIIEIVVYLGLALLVGFLVYRFLKHRAVPQEIEPEAPRAAVSRVAAPPDENWLPFEDPEDLAARGQYRRAVLLLLLLGLRRVGWGNHPRDRARTAREVLRDVPESDRRRSALGELVERVEPVRFGGLEADADVYREVHGIFVRLREAA